MAFKLAAAALAISPILSYAFALPSNQYTHIEHERRDAVTDEYWIKGAGVEPHVKIPVRIGLTQSNLENGHDMLMDIADPYSPNYGKHYTADQIIDLFAPGEETVNLVRSWIEAFGIKDVGLSANKQWLQFDAKITELEELLHAKYHTFEHRESGAVTVGCDNYHVPHHIAQHIDFVKPGINLAASAWYLPSLENTKLAKRKNLWRRTRPMGRGPTIRPADPDTAKQVMEDPGSQCDAAITPQCIRKIYNITDDLTEPVKGNSAGLYEEGCNLYSRVGLKDLLESFTNVPSDTIPVFDSIDGAPLPGTKDCGSGEADLDNQVMIPLAYPDEVINFGVDDTYYGTHGKVYGLFNDFLDGIDGSYCNYTAFGITGNSPGVDPKYPDPHQGGYKGKTQCGLYEPTKVISISYGYPEHVYTAAYQRRQCNEFMKLAMQGTTTTVSSGDNGINDDDFGCFGPHHRIFNPGNPQTCPYVVAVGATVLPPGAKAVGGEEIAVNSFGSEGGFSNVYPRQSWQAEAVENYLEKYDPPYKYYEVKYDSYPKKQAEGRYNRIGRGYPDVSALGQNIATFSTGYGGGGGTLELSGGTSASAPMFGGIITRINHHRIAAGKSSVGFINPTLYANPQMFNDVVIGANNIDKDFGGCGTSGFKCQPGWDPVTGLGTPNYGKMLEVFMALP